MAAIALVAAATAGMVGLPGTPATATTATTVETNGTITTTDDRGFPCDTLTQQCGQPRNTNWAYHSSLCVAVEGSTATALPVNDGRVCQLTAAGAVSGFCGLATGWGTMYVDILDGSAGGIDASYQFTESNYTLTFTGTARHRGTGETGTLTGVVNVSPVTPLPTDCASRTSSWSDVPSATFQFNFGV